MDSTYQRMSDLQLPDLIQGILNGERAFLSRGITLVESKKAEDQRLSAQLMDQMIQKKPESLRIGITGVPGVGKSTFIDAFGTMLTGMGKKVAVLSVDPSSNRSKGSILGDKTRMEHLSKDPNAFIRPSASGNSLGGITSKTREAILLCEVAGFDVVIVATVGVGQNEAVVKEVVDYFLLLMLAGSGDELQGIKRGIMEMADHILINKADQGNVKAAKQAQKNYENIMPLLPPNEADWKVPVDLCSAIEKMGIENAWEDIKKYKEKTCQTGWFMENRKRQLLKWFHRRIQSKLEENFYTRPDIKDEIRKKEALISAQKISVRKAVDGLFNA